MASHPIRRWCRLQWPTGRLSVAVPGLLALTVLAPSATFANPTQEPARPPGEPAEPVVRIRPQDDTARAIVDDARRHSPTVTGLIERLEASDVIVLVQSAIGLPWPTGELRLITTTPTFRFLLIRLERQRRRDEQVAHLAHELQHAVEIAEAPEVVDAQTLAHLYRRTGLRTDLPDHYETRAAMTVERQVARELYQARHR